MHITVDDIKKISPFIIQLTIEMQIKSRTNSRLHHFQFL